MRKFGLLGTSALGSTAFIGLALALAGPASAQVVQEQDPPETLEGEVELESGQDTEAEDDDQSIVVTGTRIRRPNLESNVPVTSVSAEELTSQGDVNIGDALNDLPSLRSTFSQANSTAFIGTTGLNVLDLRGLGTSRTLVLVNGRRHITAAPGSFLVDTNTIPSDLLERVDIITGGSSAVYGSDAVAGVVNFILKRDFEGFRLRGQGGISDKGDRSIQFITATAGTNFSDGRGNVAVNLEYANAEPLYFRDRDDLTGAFSGRCQFNPTDSDIGVPGNSDGVPDNTFFCGTRNAFISNGGTLAAATVNAAGPGQPGFVNSCQNPALAVSLRSRCLAFGTPQGQPRLFVFDNAGNFVENVGAADFRPFGPGNFIGGTGSTLRDTGQLAPGLDRYTANLLARFDISEAIRPFLEAKFVRVDALQEGQPSFFQGTFGGFFGGGRGIRCDNPFLTAQNIAGLQATGRCTGGTSQVFDTRPTIVSGGMTIANPNFGADITEQLPVGRFNVDFGGRSEEIRRDTYRVVAGVQGDFNDDWNYEISFNYGRTERDQTENNNLLLFDINGNPDGFLLATDVVRNSSGQIVCRVNADANPANDRPDCVPINLFGEFQPSQAALDFVNTTSFGVAKAEQYNAIAFVGGDLSQLFEFPGGPARFVVGGEYRRETASSSFDALTASGGTFFNSLQPFDPPAFEVKEAFGEIELPLLRDLPFAQELTVSAAARYSDYNTSANKTFAYNINGTYAPTQDIRFRANYSKSVRVPTLSDLFSPLSQNFNFVQDPCDILFINNNPNRAANCAALGVPPGFINTVARTQTIELLSGGNELLEEETGKSLTLGAVFTPRFFPGFSFTVDYYRIKVDNLIATLSAQTILNQCVDLPNIDNQFCALIFPRQPDGLLQSPALVSGGVNFAKQEADGIDFDVAYRRTFDNGTRLSLRGIATKVIKRNNFISPTNPDFSDRQLSELGDPEWAANFTATVGSGPVDLRYSVNYIGKQTIFAYENYFSHDGRPPNNPDITREVFYPDVLYHGARLSYKVNDQFTFYGGVDNIFDRKPPLGLLGTGPGDPFDAVGRYIYMGATVNLGGIGELINR